MEICEKCNKNEAYLCKECSDMENHDAEMYRKMKKAIVRSEAIRRANRTKEQRKMYNDRQKLYLRKWRAKKKLIHAPPNINLE